MAEPLKRVFTGQGPLISDEVTKKGLGSLYDFSGDSFNKTQDAKKAFGTGILSELLKMGRQEVVPNKEIISTETPVSDIFGDFQLSGLNTMGSRDSIYREDEEDRFNEKYGNIDITEFDPDEFPTIIDIPGITNTAGTSTKLEEAAGKFVAQDPSEIGKLIPKKAEEKFFTGQPGKPKPGEMMDDQFFKYPDATFPGTEKAMEDTFKEALLDTAKAKGETVTPETQEDLLAKYKKEFYDATGLDSSGKVDKSAALMALGISLMQNTAGSKFNVGKMLASVGEAGEKALPELTKAKDKAAAAQVAAGKYALGQIQAGKSASAALAKEERLHDRAVELAQEERRNELADKKREGIEIKGGYFDERLKGLKVRMANTNSGSVFANPESALNKVNDRLKATNGGLETVDIMLDLANNIVNKKSPSLSLVVDRANSAFSGFGIVDPDLVFGEKGMSDEDNLKALQDSLITRYKKFLTQETGNGISNTDVERLQKLLGKIDLIGNPATSLVRLEEVRQIFMSERRKVRNVADELMDPNFYQTPEIYERMNFNKFLNEKQNYSIVTPGDSTTPRIKV